MTAVIVQHSGYGYGGKEEFKHGIEPRTATPKQAAEAEKLGGKTFSDYNEAENYCYEECYGTHNSSLIPNAPGAFVNTKIDGLRIYIPREE